MARGGCKGALSDDQGRVCLVGALFYAADEAKLRFTHPIRQAAMSAVHRAAHGLDGHWFADGWNDDPATTDQDVQKFLLRVADEIEFPA